MDQQTPQTDIAAPAADPYPPERRAWTMVFVLMLLFTSSFIDRQIISLLGPAIIKDLGLSDTEFGLLAGLGFALFYTVLGLPIGRLADRMSRRVIIAWGAALWSIMTAMCGLSNTYIQLFLARMGVGVGEATLSPAAYSMISDSFRPQRLGLAMSVYMVGVALGSGLAFILGGAVIAWVSDGEGITFPILGTLKPWQATFVIVGLPGVLLALVMMLVPEPKRLGMLARGSEAPPNIPLGEVLTFLWARNRAYMAVMLPFSLITAMGYGFGIWITAFMERTYGMGVTDFAITYGVIIMVMGALGMVSGGLLNDALLGRGRMDAPILTIMFAAAVLVPITGAVGMAPGPWWAMSLMGTTTFFMSFTGGVAAAALQMITPNQMRGQVSAVHLFIANLLGLGMGPAIIGMFTDHVFGNPNDLRYALSLMGVVLAPLALVFTLWGRTAFRRSAEEAKAWSGKAA